MTTQNFNLATLFETVAQAVPQRIAMVCGEQSLSYRELDQRATRLASALQQRGIVRGSHVGIQLLNSGAYVEAFLACCKIGAAPININYRYVADELVYLFRTMALDALIVGSEFSDAVQPVLEQLPPLKVCLWVAPSLTSNEQPLQEDYETFLNSGNDLVNDMERSDDDLVILCTGGTTGMPKGVMWPHKNLFMAALGGGGIYFGRRPISTLQELAGLVNSAPPLRYLAGAPLMHSAAMWATLISLFAGHTVVLDASPRFDAENLWDVVEKQQVQILSVVGDAMALPLIQALEKQPQRWDLSRLMTFGNGGAVFSTHLQQRLLSLLPQVTINNGMGTSESGMIGGGPRPGQGEGFMRLAPREDLAVIDDTLKIVTEVGAEGTLARTGYTPTGYWGDPVKSAETFISIAGRTWVMTGDRARIDNDGSMVVLGRGSQCINTGGEKVFPEEVEEVLRRYEAVRDVLVIGMPDERWGQRVVAVVETEPGVTFDQNEMLQICRRHVSGYKVPRAVFFAQRIQRSPAGKADYRWARDEVQNQLEKVSP